MSELLPSTDDRHVPEEYVGKIPSNYYCRGWNEKREKYCKARAGAGTDHPGEGRCRHHGGDTPITHGRYSTVTRERVRDLYEEFAQDPDPLNTIHELHMARALLRDYIERYDEWAEAFLAWHESWGDPEKQVNPKPRKVLDLADAIRHLDTVSKMVERIEKIRSDQAISRPDLLRVITEVARAVEMRVQDPALLEKLREDILDIRLA